MLKPDKRHIQPFRGTDRVGTFVVVSVLASLAIAARLGIVVKRGTVIGDKLDFDANQRTLGEALFGIFAKHRGNVPSVVPRSRANIRKLPKNLVDGKTLNLGIDGLAIVLKRLSILTEANEGTLNVPNGLIADKVQSRGILNPHIFAAFVILEDKRMLRACVIHLESIVSGFGAFVAIPGIVGFPLNLVRGKSLLNELSGQMLRSVAKVAFVQFADNLLQPIGHSGESGHSAELLLHLFFGNRAEQAIDKSIGRDEMPGTDD